MEELRSIHHQGKLHTHVRRHRCQQLPGLPRQPVRVKGAVRPGGPVRGGCQHRAGNRKDGGVGQQLEADLLLDLLASRLDQEERSLAACMGKGVL